MTERPIIFNGPMVRAIRDARKTQTRRVAKLVDGTGGAKLLRLKSPYAARLVDGMGPVWSPAAGSPEAPLPKDRLTGPYGQPGDLLYVRETWAWRGNCWDAFYRADGVELPAMPPNNKWKPSIHMPKSVARIWLKVTDVRVERVQDIGDDDAIAEGVEPDSNTGSIEEFSYVWDSINAKRGFGWDINPWVFVICFERITTPTAGGTQ